MELEMHSCFFLYMSIGVRGARIMGAEMKPEGQIQIMAEGVAFLHTNGIINLFIVFS